MPIAITLHDRRAACSTVQVFINYIMHCEQLRLDDVQRPQSEGIYSSKQILCHVTQLGFYCLEMKGLILEVKEVNSYLLKIKGLIITSWESKGLILTSWKSKS